MFELMEHNIIGEIKFNRIKCNRLKGIDYFTIRIYTIIELNKFFGEIVGITLSCYDFGKYETCLKFF